MTGRRGDRVKDLRDAARRYLARGETSAAGEHLAALVLQSIEENVIPGMQPGHLWRVTAPDRQIWCETSSLREAVKGMRPGDQLSRLWTSMVYSEWVPTDPDGLLSRM